VAQQQHPLVANGAAAVAAAAAAAAASGGAAAVVVAAPPPADHLKQRISLCLPLLLSTCCERLLPLPLLMLEWHVVVLLLLLRV
jgi:hypothetical protein